MEPSDRQRPSDFTEVRREKVQVIESMTEWHAFQLCQLFERGAEEPRQSMKKLLRMWPEVYMAVADCEEFHEESVPREHRSREWASFVHHWHNRFLIRQRLLGCLFGKLHDAKSELDVPHAAQRFSAQRKKGYDQRVIPPALQVHDIAVASTESNADIRSLLLRHAETKVMEGKVDYLFAVEPMGADDRIAQWEQDWFTLLTNEFPDGGEKYWLVSQDWDKRWRPAPKGRKKK